MLRTSPFYTRFSLVASLYGILNLSVYAGEPKEARILISPDSELNLTSGDDIERLKELAMGVGREFQPNAESDQKLRDLGMRWIRCINVDRVAGEFTPEGKWAMGKPVRPEEHLLIESLESCRKVGANPHIVIGLIAPAALRVDPGKEDERKLLMGQHAGGHSYWNGDWEKLRAYWKAIFRHVLVDSGFPNARFEAGNEPDIGGQFPRLVKTQGAMGSKALYEDYLEFYRNLAQAAKEVEEENPGVKVNLGGPALAWAYSFTHGEINWAVEFLKDAAREKLKLDFLGIHFYGNISSLNGEYPAGYPSFAEMYETTKEARDKYLPGLPILMTEWGASYNTSNKEESTGCNAGNVGAAWSAAFLNQLLETNDFSGGLFLVTTDMLTVNPASEKERNDWGWPSLYVNHIVFGRPWPKATAHLFQMISDLGPKRIAAEGLKPKEGLNGWVSVDPETGDLTILLWNYLFRIPETGQAPIDMGSEFAVSLQAEKLGASNSSSPLKWERWLVSADTSNAFAEFQATGTVTAKSELQKVENLEIKEPKHSFPLPSGSLTFIRISKPQP